MGFVLWQIGEINLVIKILIGVIVYIIGLYFVRFLNKTDLVSLKTINHNS
jgi:hypothetical protein